MFWKCQASKKIAEKKCSKQADVSVQPTGKWVERISQSERTLR